MRARLQRRCTGRGGEFKNDMVEAALNMSGNGVKEDDIEIIMKKKNSEDRLIAAYNVLLYRKFLNDYDSDLQNRRATSAAYSKENKPKLTQQRSWETTAEGRGTVC